MFGVLRVEGVVMLSYNSAFTYNITSSLCTLSLPYTLNSIPCSPMLMCKLQHVQGSYVLI